MGLAIAVLLDATVIRALLVPATMRLLGTWTWWAPRRMARLGDRLGFSHLEDGMPEAQPIPLRAGEEDGAAEAVA